MKYLKANLQILFPIMAITWLGCGKDTNPTIVEGIVMDSKTGEGLDSVEIQYETRSIPKDIHDQPFVSNHIVESLDDGSFLIELEPGFQFTGVVYFNKIGYNQKILSIGTHFNAKTGEKNENHINMWVVDSWLTLEVLNNQTLHDSLYVTVGNKSVHPDIYAGGIINNPIYLLLGQKIIEVFPYSSETYTTIRWATSYDDYQNDPVIDSVYMISNDTSVYTISY